MLRAEEDQELTALSAVARRLMEERILPGIQHSEGAVAVAEVKIRGALPGGLAMQAIQRVLADLDQDDGTPLTVLFGVALKDGSRILSLYGVDRERWG